MFHRVVPDEPTAFGLPSSYRIRGTALTIDELERVLDDSPEVLPLAEIEDALLAGRAPKPGVVLTFDDGYREHAEVVLPVLMARRISATFYVATGLHEGSAYVALVDAWYWVLDHATRSSARVRLPDGGQYEGRLDSVASKNDWVVGVPKAALLAAGPGQQRAMLATLAESAEVVIPDNLAARLYMSRSDWSRLMQSGMRVGAHSVTHARLPDLDDSDVDAEVRASIDAVPRGPEGVTFAYPDGAYTPAIASRVARFGARSGVTCDPGGVTRGADRMRLPRVFVRGSPGRRR
jgi:peptidoglycan/xylan/chitin deacetylase (PgdA/CDA1 family)